MALQLRKKLSKMCVKDRNDTLLLHMWASWWNVCGNSDRLLNAARSIRWTRRLSCLLLMNWSNLNTHALKKCTVHESLWRGRCPWSSRAAAVRIKSTRWDLAPLQGCSSEGGCFYNTPAKTRTMTSASTKVSACACRQTKVSPCACRKKSTGDPG